MAMPEQYQYYRLQDAAISVGQKVNFYGVVREYDQPKKTRGSDFICTMTVEDMSFNSPGLRVLVFSSGLDGLPQVKSIGDVIRFHRVAINIHNVAPQAVARIKTGASFLLFDGTDGSGYTPYQTSSRNYTMQDYDRQILDLIRTWTKSQPLSSGSCDYLVPISGIKEGSYFDLCCKILAVDQESDHAIIMYVWDGTDAPPAYLMALLDTQRRDIHPDLGDMKLGHLPPLPRELLQSFPSVGTVLAVVSTEELPLQPPERGSWVKFRNLTCRVQFGIYEAVFVHESKISLLPSNHELVKKCERSFNDRLNDHLGRLSQWAPKPLHSITVTDYENVPFSTLREILTHSQVTFKFRSLVRVIAILPSAVEEFSVLQKSGDMEGPLDTTSEMMQRDQSEKSSSEYMYRMRLDLEDATGRIQAYLCGEDAVCNETAHFLS